MKGVLGRSFVLWCEMASELLKLKNIDPKTVGWLEAVGIHSKDDLIALGAVEVYRRLQIHYPVTLNTLWALQGAILDIPFNQLPELMKQELLGELQDTQS